MPGQPAESAGDVTALLHRAASGDAAAFDQLLPLVYGELNSLARRRLAFERDGHTLNTTALVHEAYLRLVGQTRAQWQNRHQFYGVASEAMRRILVDYAKQRRAIKRGGDAPHVPIDMFQTNLSDGGLFSDEQAIELLALNDALDRLAVFNPQGARIVQYRFFGGLGTEEVAQLLGTSDRTIRRSWSVAKAWLRRELGDALTRSASLLRAAPGA